MKSTFIAGLCIIALLGAGCASTGGKNDDSGRDAVQPPQPPGDSVAKGGKKPRTNAAKPPQPRDGGVSKDDTEPQTDRHWQPNVIVPANYPSKALDLGIEGYVLLEYTVTQTGSLKDIVVIDSTPPGYFEESAMKAATEFRYQPRIVNGEPVDVPRSRYKMIFKLEYIRPRS
jgi:periplasmic protein TonB